MNSCKINFGSKFKKDMKRCKKRGFKIELLLDLIENYLAKGIDIPAKHRPHLLSGNLAGFWECHVERAKGDWILLWEVDKENNTIE